MGRGERPIKPGDSSYSPKCFLEQPRAESDGGRATDRARGSHILPTPDKLRMPLDMPGSEGKGAKVLVREGKNPEHQLRSLK